MFIINITVFDDDVFALSSIMLIIKDFLASHPLGEFYTLSGFSIEKDFEKYLFSHSSEIYFLDISTKMNENFGIEMAKKIREKDKSAHVVFITGFDKYVFDALDNLIKPSGYIMKSDMKSGIIKTLAKVINELDTSGEYVCLKSGSGYYERIDSILYAYYNSKTRRSEVHLVDGGIVFISESLQKLCEKLPKSFIKINRNLLANASKFSKTNLYENRVYFSNGECFTVSRDCKKALKNLIASL